MCDFDSWCRITRVVEGDHHNLELAQLPAVVRRIQLALRDVSDAERVYIGTALLNLAVSRIQDNEASKRAATLKTPMSDAAHANPLSAESAPGIDLQVLHV